MKLVAFVGSVREKSFNKQIAHFFRDRYKDSFDVNILEMSALPYFDQDVEEDPPEVVKAFKEQVAEADGVLIVTPEYNHSVPGMLKNALDWLSRVEKVMNDKPVLLVGASTGVLGTVRCQMHLRQILASPGLAAKVLPGNEVFIGKVQDKVDENGKVTDSGTIDFLDAVVNNYVEFAKSLRK